MIEKINIMLNYEHIFQLGDIICFKKLFRLFAIKCGNIQA